MVFKTIWSTSKVDGMIFNHSVHFKVKLLKWTESSPVIDRGLRVILTVRAMDIIAYQFYQLVDQYSIQTNGQIIWGSNCFLNYKEKMEFYAIII